MGDQRAIRGADLLALAADTPPDTAGLSSLRRMMRQVITFHLGGGELKAWRVLR
jgi:DNA repair protein RecO (recombination protein O)